MKISPEHLTYTSNADGYMLSYKGTPIGGVGVKLPRERPLRGNQAENNRIMFSSDARREIRDLINGHGQQRFITAIEALQTLESNS